MNSTIALNLRRWIIFIILQGLVLQRVNLNEELFAYVHLLLYPLFIILLPLRLPAPLVIFASFVMGLLIDLFYFSYGIHAAAAVLTAFARTLVLDIYKPVEGYNLNSSPTKDKMGASWFYRYAATMLLIHCFTYFSIEAFTFAYIGDILLRTIFSFIISMILIVMYMSVFNPKE